MEERRADLIPWTLGSQHGTAAAYHQIVEGGGGGQGWIFYYTFTHHQKSNSKHLRFDLYCTFFTLLENMEKVKIWARQVEDCPYSAPIEQGLILPGSGNPPQSLNAALHIILKPTQNDDSVRGFKYIL